MALATQVTLGLTILLYLGKIGMALWEQVHLNSATLLTALWMELCVSLAQLALLFVTSIMFLAWFRCAYENAAANGMRLRYGLGWAIGSWFVPILSLVRPVRMASDMMTHASGRFGRVSGLVVLWWITFLLSNFVFSWAQGLATMSARRTIDVGPLVTYIFIACAESILAAVLAIVFVRRLTRLQLESGLAATVAVFGDDNQGTRQVVGSNCGSCFQRISTMADSVVCSSCDLPLHATCLTNGRCPKCAGQNLRLRASHY